MSSQLQNPLPLCQLAPSWGVIRRARGRLEGGREKAQLFTFIIASPKSPCCSFQFSAIFPTLPGAGGDTSEVPEAPGRATSSEVRVAAQQGADWVVRTAPSSFCSSPTPTRSCFLFPSGVPLPPSVFSHLFNQLLLLMSPLNCLAWFVCCPKNLRGGVGHACTHPTSSRSVALGLPHLW